MVISNKGRTITTNKKVPVRGNPIAKDLGTTKYRLRIVKSTKVYTRNVKHRQALVS